MSHAFCTNSTNMKCYALCIYTIYFSRYFCILILWFSIKFKLNFHNMNNNNTDINDSIYCIFFSEEPCLFFILIILLLFMLGKEDYSAFSLQANHCESEYESYEIALNRMLHFRFSWVRRYLYFKWIASENCEAPMHACSYWLHRSLYCSSCFGFEKCKKKCRSISTYLC